MVFMNNKMKLKTTTKLDLIKNAYNCMIGELTPNQLFELTRGNTVAEQASIAKEVSKSKNVWYLANVILWLTIGDGTGLDALQKYNIARGLRGELIGE